MNKKKDMRLVLFFYSAFIIPTLVSGQTENSIAQENQESYAEMRILSSEAKKKGNVKLADSIAIVYKNKYLNMPNDTLLFTRKNLQFILDFPNLINAKDRLFKFCYEHNERVDKLIDARSGYARDFVKYVICKEEVDVSLYKDDRVLEVKPNWGKIYRNIQKKYSREYANEIIPDAKLRFYRRVENWRKFGTLFDAKIKKNKPTHTSNCLGGNYGDSWTLNSTAWDVFLNCDERTVLKKALNWIDQSIILWGNGGNFQYLDTKANILYKLGDKSAAIQYEERAFVEGRSNKDVESNLTKMRQGIPTWNTK